MVYFMLDRVDHGAQFSRAIPHRPLPGSPPGNERPFNGLIMMYKNDLHRRSPGNGPGATKNRREEFTPTRSGACSPLSTGAFRLSLTMTQINVLVDFLRQIKNQVG